MRHRMKLGAVSYLNALPLVHYLAERPRLAPPAALDRLLRIGEVELATAPVVTLCENPSWKVVPGIAIATRSTVKSVRLIFKKQGMTLGDLRSISLDLESKTSNLLLKVLLHYKYRRRLEDIHFYYPLPSSDADAALFIGDKALKEEYRSLEGLDLGGEWTSWTGLPFVFAAWIGSAPEISEKQVQILREARDRALTNLGELAKQQSVLPELEAKRYLSENISYEFEGAEIEGLQRFCAYAHELGLIQNDFQLSFYLK